MKKLMIIVFSLSLAVAASAQRGGHVGHVGHYGGFGHTRIVVGTYAPYWGYAYSPWAFPYYEDGYVPSKLQMKIDEISADYKDRIWSARHDKSISKAQRKQAVHELKTQRELAILHAKEDYYNQDRND